mgnify:CR=1 FL=1
MKKRNFLIYLLIAAVILSLLSFTALAGCRRARLERLKNLKEAQEDYGEKDSQDEEAGDAGEAQSKEDVELEEDTEEIDTDEETEDSAEDETSEEETEETEETEQEETAESSEETDGKIEEDTAEETVQLTEEFINLDMEGGSITRDGFASVGIGCGDYSNNDEVRAFASFNISGIAGAKIQKASIKAIDGRKDGEPFAKYGPMIIKAVYWGPFKVNPSNFDIDGVELANFTVKDFTIANTKLNNDLQNAVNHGMNRYQICLYFEMEGTDGDGIQDLIYHYPEKIILTVTYSIAGE